MRVEITEERLSDTDPETGRHYLHEAGDVITVPDSLGKTWCKHGWAKDVDGNVPTGERKVVGAELKPASVKRTLSDSSGS